MIKASAHISFADDTTLYTCLYDVINMSCADDGLVFIVTASHGQYASTCSEECCVPDAANDCVETLEGYDAEEWNNLKLACNYQTDCLFQHRPHVMTTCGANDAADYLAITYVCSNGT